MTVHYIVTPIDADALLTSGRALTSAKGEPLESILAIRLALRLDGEVTSREQP